MGMRWSVSVLGIGLSMCCVVPPALAVDDEGTAEAAQAGLSETSREQILQQIELTRQTDPELAAEMEKQLQLLESGELDLTAEGVDHARGTFGAGTPTGTGNTSTTFSSTLPSGGLVGPPVDIGGGGVPGDNLPPEVRAQLEQLFQEKGTGDPAKDAAVREEAEKILREHGIDPREIGPGEHMSPEALEHMSPEGLEHMSPEAREQMEQFFSEHEAGEQPTMDRETFEREFGTYEAPIHEYEAPPEFEQPEYEMPPAPEYDYQPPQQP